MSAQALSGIAKDLNKMSAKASVKTLVGGGGEAQLFNWVVALTGSKNALKGPGFFVGAAMALRDLYAATAARLAIGKMDCRRFCLECPAKHR